MGPPSTTEPIRTDPSTGDQATCDQATTDLAEALRLTIARLARRIRQHQGSTLTPSQYSALATIERHGPIRLSDLAVAERIAPPTITKIVAGLEEAGQVRRDVDPDDRRAALVQLTTKGHATLARLRTERTAYLRRRIEQLEPGDRRRLEAALPLLAALVEDEPPAGDGR